MWQLSVPLCILACLPFGASAATACQSLGALLPGRVFHPSSAIYRNSEASYFAIQARLGPECILRPTNSFDVSVAVKVLTQDKSNRFAVRSGGHGPNPGFANTPDGVTIDLRSMNGIRLSLDRQLVSIQSGAVWGDVYQELDQFNISVPGGRGSNIGVGGFLTGGGISAFGRRIGWGCDNVAKFEVVLASGELINANELQFTDMFRALKGGGNNFGIVTRIHMRTHPQEPFRAGSIFFSPEANAQSFKTFTDFKSSVDYDIFEEAEQSYIATVGQYYTSNQLFYTGPARNQTGLRRWEAVQPQMGNTLRVFNMSDFAREIQGYQSINKQVVYVGTTFVITPTILEQIHAIWQTATVDTFNAVQGMTAVMTWQSTPRTPNANRPNSLGFAPGSFTERNLVSVLLSNYWDLAADSDRVIHRTFVLNEAFETLAKSQNSYVPFKYANYANGKQDVINGYGSEAAASLRKASQKYDPTGVFQNQVNGGFKLFRE